MTIKTLARTWAREGCADLAVRLRSSGSIVAVPHVGGLHHRYDRGAGVGTATRDLVGVTLECHPIARRLPVDDARNNFRAARKVGVRPVGTRQTFAYDSRARTPAAQMDFSVGTALISPVLSPY